MNSPVERIRIDQAKLGFTPARRRFAFATRRARREVFFYSAVNGAVRGQVVTAGDGGIVQVRDVAPAGEADLASLLVGGKRRRIVAVLTRSQYLLRTFEAPPAGADETYRMLRLEAEILLPPEFGDFELSYSRLLSQREGHHRYEVYIARRAVIAECLDCLQALGRQPTEVLPSAIVWRLLLEAGEGCDLMVAPAGGGEGMEAAYLGADRSLSIRAIESAAGGGDGLPGGLVECLRSRLSAAPPGEPIVVGWLGADCPSDRTARRVVFEDIAATVAGGMADAGQERPVDGLFLTLGRALLSGDLGRIGQTANLLPRKAMLAGQRRLACRQVMAATAASLLAVALGYAGLKVMTGRYRSARSDLEARTARIRLAGEEVGRQIDQLNAIRAAKATHHAVYDMLSGLHDASPPGVTFSQVKLDSAGNVQLRGQAQSLALPLLLPERLEKVPAFAGVVLRDAGQVKKGTAAVTEFRLDCRLRREGGG